MFNEFAQPIGDDLGGWEPPSLPQWEKLEGAVVTLEPLDAFRHAPSLFEAYANAPDSLWTYMPWGPFGNADELGMLIDELVTDPYWQPYAILADGAPLGFLSYLRMDQQAGSIEIGGISYSPALQRTAAATEALYLSIKNVFDLGYRRCEWKCDDLNEPSRAAALRLGFRYEGTFRKATHYKGRNRDTAWYAITDEEWPILEAAFSAWLSPTNFDDEHRQRRSLAEIRADLAGQRMKPQHPPP
jgi:RimJ/RimL family protein N-acetyltransferase